MQEIDLTINPDTQLITSGSAPVLYAGNLALLRCSLVNSDGAYALPATNEFYACIDTALGASHTDLVIAADDKFNDTDDWADADPTAGKICFQLTTATQAVIDALSADRRIKVYLEIWTREPAGSWQILMQEQVVLYNVTSDFTPVSTEGITYLTSADLAGLITSSDEGYTITAPDSDQKTFDPATATLGEALDFIATLARTLDSKGVI